MANKTPTVVIASKAGQAFQQEIRAGVHKIISDEPVTVGGSDQGPTPVELFLGGLGACTAMTMQMLARRRQWDLQKVTVRIYQAQVDDPANSGQKILQISEEIEVEGNLQPAEVTALEAAAKRCPVYKMLTGPKLVVTSINHVKAPQVVQTQPPAPQSGSGSPQPASGGDTATPSTGTTAAGDAK